MTFFAAALLMVDFTTTYTTTTTSMRFALDNDALRRGVAVAIRRGRRVRRGYKKEQRGCEKNLVLLFTTLRYRSRPNDFGEVTRLYNVLIISCSDFGEIAPSPRINSELTSNY